MARVAPAPVLTATRLLIIEDDGRYARALGELLTESLAGLAITHVTTIDEACKLVNRGVVDIVILDLGLPDSEGLDSLRRLNGCVREIPIIVLTARADEAAAIAALNIGAE